MKRVIELVSFLDAMGVALIITLIPFFTKELHISAFGFGVITSLYGLCQVVGGACISYLSKSSISRKTILLVSSIGSGISYTMLFAHNNLNILVLSRVLVGFVKQTTTSCKALVMMSNDVNKSKRFSFLAAIRHMGSFMGSAALSVITRRFPPEYAIGLSVLLFCMESVLIVLFIHEDHSPVSVIQETPSTLLLKKESTDHEPSKKKKKKTKVDIRVHANVGAIVEMKHAKNDTKPWQFAWSPFMLYMIYLFFIDTLNKGFGSIKILLLQDQFEVTPHEISLVYVVSNLFMFITEFFITPFISSSMSSYTVAILSFFLLFLGKWSQLLITNFSQYMLLCTVTNTIGEEVFATTFINILSKISPGPLISQYLSYYDVVESICRLIGPIFLGKVISQYGFIYCEYFMCFSFLLIGIIWSVYPVETMETVKVRIKSKIE